MTSLYTFRLIFITFHGEAKTEAHAGHGIAHWLPLSVLIVLSTFVGAMIVPPLHGVLPESVGHAGGEAKHSLEIASGAIALAGILLAALLFLGKRRFVTAIANSGIGRFLRPGGSLPGASTGSTTNCSSSRTLRSAMYCAETRSTRPSV